MYNLFNSIKLAIDMSLIQQYSSISMRDATQVKIEALNCPKHSIDELKSTFSFLTGVIIEISFIFTLISSLTYMVGEKQSKMKEYLGIMGIKWHISAFAWSLRPMAIYLLLSILIATTGTIELQPRLDENIFLSKTLFGTTNFFVIFLIW